MREQEFRARDKVVQKMSRGGLQEKNLTKGTEQGISQRDSDYSFQARGDGKWEEGMAGRTAARGRESPGQNRNVFFQQTERGGEPYGGSQATQDMDERCSFSAVENSSMPEPPREYGESHRIVSESRQEGRYSAQSNTIHTMQPNEPVQDRKAAGPEQGRKAVVQGMGAERNSAEYRGVEGGGQSRSREIFGYGKASPGQSRETDSTGNRIAHERQRKTLFYTPGENGSENISARRGYSIKPADDRQESGSVYPENQRDREEEGTGEATADMPSESGRRQVSAMPEQQRRRKVQRTNARAWREKYSLSGNPPQDSDTAVGRTEAGFRGQERQRGERLKQAPFGEKDEPVSSKAERRAAAAKARVQTEADSSGHSREKRKNRKDDGGTRETSSSTRENSRSAGRKGRLRFEADSGSGKPEESLLKRTGGGLVHTAQSAAVGKFHQKLREVEQDNTGVESAHKAEAAVERAAGRVYRTGKERLRSRPYRAMKRAEKRAVAAERDAALKKFQAEYPQMQKKTLAKWVQKQKIKRKYAAAAREASKGAGRSAKVLSATGRIARQAAEYIKKKAGGTAVGIILAGVLLFSLCGSLFTSCSSLLTGAGSSVMSACYLAEDGEISNAELRYTELETDLQLEIADTEWRHPGYDEYRYNIGEIGHNPFELMGYLSAVFDDFTSTQVEPELQRLFGLQYRLTREEITETRIYLDEEGEEQEYEWRILKTVLSVRPLSEILSGSLAAGEQAERYAFYMETYGGRQYFGNPFDFPWLGSVTSPYGYRVHPIHGGRDLHRGVDIGAEWGTPIRAIQDGRVASAGEAGSYGLCLVIAGEDGYQSRYAHCSSLAVSAGQEVRKGDIVAYVGDTGDSTGSHLHLEVVHDGEYLDPVYFVENGGGGYTAGGNAAGRPPFPADPGTPMGDGAFEAVRAEAERHMGLPYVWGGSSPETSFDCSGYVSWVINQSGAGSVGRQTAQGLCNLCTPVSWEDLRPGDLVFFTGTYSSLTPVSHVGIYMGGGRMAHAGDPIGYANIGSSRYWKAHFYCGGRLP